MASISITSPSSNTAISDPPIPMQGTYDTALALSKATPGDAGLTDTFTIVCQSAPAGTSTWGNSTNATLTSATTWMCSLNTGTGTFDLKATLFRNGSFEASDTVTNIIVT